MKITFQIVLTAVWIALVSTPVPAQLLLVLDDPDQTGPAGGILTYTGQLTNEATDPMSIEGFAFNFSPPAPDFDAIETSEFDDFLALGGYLNPGEAFSAPLFRVAIHPGVPAGTVAMGEFTVNGVITDSSGNQTDVFTSASFSATVGSGASVPELGSTCFASSLIVAVIFTRTRRIRLIPYKQRAHAIYSDQTETSHV